MNRLSKLMLCSLLAVLLGTPMISAAADNQATKKKSSASKAKPTSAQPATAAAAPVAAAVPTPEPAASAPPVQQYQYPTRPAIAGGANPFNRLLKVARRPHMPPSEDEIHDPTNEGTMILQQPLDAYEDLPKTETGLGNGVHWVKALDDGNLKPRWERTDPGAEPMVMDMNIVRVPKSSVPDVVFPHRQHTLWLACSNCHPDIFIPRKGANQISMAAIILGQKCGVCHGKVAFPISECKRCHSQPKKVAVNGGGPVKP
ncbi:MAG: c(7)-type cytochrome triheme domain-containing protein [Gallionella sp.]